MTLRAADYDYEYPEELIAAKPAEPRDSSRLLVLDRETGARRHLHFRDLPSLLSPGDCVVVNRTKVTPCRLIGKKASGGKADLLLVKELGPAKWTALASGLKLGQALLFEPGLQATVGPVSAEGEYELTFNLTDLRPWLADHGHAPLPPYILKRQMDRTDAAREHLERYQTVYARDQGSIAAPTAGLHFTPAVFKALAVAGVQVAYLTLHVGRGTFRPITAESADEHVMLPEWFKLEPSEAEKISAAKRVIAVGTTSTRTLETLAARPEGFGPGEGWSSLYIYPGYQWKIVGGLITNFHLPRSTPLMLAASFAGRETLLEAYRDAVALKYRLYSFGDAMLIL